MTSKLDTLKRWRRWQFSLRTLLLSCPLAGIALGFGGPACLRLLERDNTVTLPTTYIGLCCDEEESIVLNVRPAKTHGLAVTMHDEQPFPADPVSFWSEIAQHLSAESERGDKLYVLLRAHDGVQDAYLQQFCDELEPLASENRLALGVDWVASFEH
jgi:hypothetical protein